MDHSDPIDLQAAADVLLAEARSAASGRAARSLLSGSDSVLRQTLLALAEGHALAEHTAPGPASLQVLAGAATLVVGERRTALRASQWVPLPTAEHEVRADGDAVMLLTVAVDR